MQQDVMLEIQRFSNRLCKEQFSACSLGIAIANIEPNKNQRYQQKSIVQKNLDPSYLRSTRAPFHTKDHNTKGNETAKQTEKNLRNSKNKVPLNKSSSNHDNDRGTGKEKFRFGSLPKIFFRFVLSSVIDLIFVLTSLLAMSYLYCFYLKRSWSLSSWFDWFNQRALEFSLVELTWLGVFVLIYTIFYLFLFKFILGMTWGGMIIRKLRLT